MAAHSDDFVILACTVLMRLHECECVTDRQRDVWTIAKTREAFCCCAQKDIFDDVITFKTKNTFTRYRKYVQSYNL